MARGPEGAQPQGQVGTCAPTRGTGWHLALGATWIVLATSKAVDPRRSVAIHYYVPDVAVARLLALFVLLVEAGLGLALLSGSKPARRGALVASLVLLVVLGAWAIIDAPVQCGCAGRLAKLTPAGHSALVCGMLALAGLALLEVGRDSLWDVSGRRGLVAGAVLIAVTGLGLRALGHAAPLVDSAAEWRTATASTRSTVQPPLGTHASARHVRGVVAALGRPMEGVQVWLAKEAPQVQFAGGTARTNARGEFDISSSYGPADEFEVCAWHEGWIPAVRRVKPGQWEDEAIGLSLVSQGAAVSGRVLAGGAGVPRARIRAWAGLGNEFDWDAGIVLHPSGGSSWARTTTDSLGRFELRGLRDSDYWLFVEADGYASDYQPLRAVPGAAIEVVLWPVFALRALAVDASTGEPVQASEIAVVARKGTWGPPRGRVGRGSLNMESDSSCLVQATIGLYMPRGASDGTEPLVLFAQAPGYAKSRAEFVPHLWAPDVPIERIPLSRYTAEQFSSVVVELEPPHREGADPGFTGELIAKLSLDDRRNMSVPLTFTAGRSHPLLLPPGIHTLQMEGGNEGTFMWAAASEPTGFSVSEGQDGRVPLPMLGTRILIRPRTVRGDLLRHVHIGLECPGRAAQFDSGEYLNSLWDDKERALQVWVTPGPIRLDVSRPGCRSSHHAFNVEIGTTTRTMDIVLEDA